jgi:orotidine 5'-phosphate decarboxylase subfamily 1
MLPYDERASYCQNPIAIRLCQIMAKKETNLAVSIDVVSKKELLKLAELLGPEICILKTHVDILEDFDINTAQQLTALADKYKFIIFEDRKFADIGYTVRLQYEKGVFKIAKWAHIVNAHSLPGPSIIEALKQVGLPRGNALLLIAQMSSQGNLANDQYSQKTIKMALSHKDFVIGFIAHRKLIDDPSFIYMTPGVQIKETNDDLGQQYMTPNQAIFERESDIIIVGRGIYQAADPLQAARRYRQMGWEAYLDRFKTK